MESISEHADANVCKVMAGNKVDLVDERKVNTKEATQYAAQYKMRYFDTGAKTKVGIDELFEHLATQVY